MAQINAKASKPSRGTCLHRNLQNISTTLGFGEVTSLGFIEMQGKTKVKGEIKSLIRTATMPVPTFGTISYKQYARFIPTTDIFRNNTNMKTELPITTQFGTFIPKNQPYIISNYISALLLRTEFCRVAIYGNRGVQQANGYDFTGILTKCEYTEYNTDSFTELNKLIDNRLNPTGGSEYISPISIGEKDLDITIDSRITPNNCDFTLIRCNTDAIAKGQTNWSSKDYNAFVYCFRLTKKGKTLYRILTSLGWKFSLRNEEKVNILPFLAYYKGYFELFEPKNTTTGANVYTNTSCFRLSDYICEHDTQNVYTYERDERDVLQIATPTTLFINLLKEISESYYYNKPNLITAHIATPSVGTQQVTTQVPPVNATMGMITGAMQRQNGDPWTNNVTAPSLKLLMKMYVISNKHSVIGGNIRKLIQSLYGYDAETLEGIVYDCGRKDYDLDITMIPSQADTLTENGGAQLGEIGGLATGRSQKDEKNNNNLQYSFNASDDGYLMIYAVIVPNCGFFQGQDPRLKHGTEGKYSLYTPDFDSIGLEISTKSLIQAERVNEIPQTTINGINVSTESRQENTAYGFIPRYMDWKLLANDIVNGDLRRNQYKMQLRPYYLGKELSEPSVVAEIQEDNSYKLTFGAPNDVPIATPELRAVGKYNWLENFNKIFYQYEERLIIATNPRANSFQEVFGFDDPFIIHNENKYEKTDHMKPTTESFETDGEDNNSLDVEHA